MIITPELLAQVYYNSDISELEEKAQEWCVKTSGFNVPWETDDIQKLKYLMQDRLLVCACGKASKVIKYYVIAWGGTIDFVPYPPIDIVDNHITKIKLEALREHFDKYQALIVCCSCGGVVDAETGKCRWCNLKYNTTYLPLTTKIQ